MEQHQDEMLELQEEEEAAAAEAAAAAQRAAHAAAMAAANLDGTHTQHLTPDSGWLCTDAVTVTCNRSKNLLCHTLSAAACAARLGL